MRSSIWPARFAPALLCQGGLPPAWIILVGGITVFAGYTAVYALNDIVDYRTDRRLFESLGRDARGRVPGRRRHPASPGPGLSDPAPGRALVRRLRRHGPDRLLAAQSRVRRAAGFRLSAGGRLLSAAFGQLFPGDRKRRGQVPGAPGRGLCRQSIPVALVSGRAFRLGIRLGNRRPEHPGRLHDAARDRQTGARTVPVVLGPARASRWALRSLAASLVLSVPLLALSPLTVAPAFWLAALAGGALLVLPPAVRLTRGLADADAAALFNRASFYPALVLVALVAFLIVRHAD